MPPDNNPSMLSSLIDYYFFYDHELFYKITKEI